MNVDVPPLAVDRAWAVRLGVEVETLARRELTVVPHGERLAGYVGAEILRRRGGGTIVSVPEDWLQRVAERCRDLELDSLMHPRTFLRLFDNRVTRWIGASYQGYVERRHVRAQLDADRGARALSSAERPALNALERACSPVRWQTAGVDADADVVCGCIVDGQLVAAASLRAQGPGVADPCVVTHPDHSGRGYGTSVVAALLREAFRREVVVLYQTLEANTAAVALAERLGFRRYGQKMAIRLDPARDTRREVALGG